MPNEALVIFKHKFGFTPPHLVQTPVRIELIGSAAGDDDGLFMGVAIDRFAYLAGAPRSDGRVHLISAAFPDGASFSLGQVAPDPQAPWADIIKGILLNLKRRGIPVGGFNAAIHTTFPPRTGLGGTAALALATALLVRKLYPFSVTETGFTQPPCRDGAGEMPLLTARQKLALARFCQQAERQSVGITRGLTDYLVPLFGKAFHVLQIDGRSGAVEQIPLVGNIALVLCGSGLPPGMPTDERSPWKTIGQAAARALGVKSLRQVDPRFLKTNRARLTEREYQYAYHIVSENRRVVFSERSLRAEDWEQFGQFLFQSHESAATYFHNSSAELNQLVDLARSHPGCLGARMCGIGLGGATVNLVKLNALEDFRKYLSAGSTRLRKGSLEPFICRIVDAAK
jgi:galactokinase